MVVSTVRIVLASRDDCLRCVIRAAQKVAAHTSANSSEWSRRHLGIKATVQLVLPPGLDAGRRFMVVPVVWSCPTALQPLPGDCRHAPVSSNGQNVDHSDAAQRAWMIRQFAGIARQPGTRSILAPCRAGHTRQLPGSATLTYAPGRISGRAVMVDHRSAAQLARQLGGNPVSLDFSTLIIPVVVLFNSEIESARSQPRCAGGSPNVVVGTNAAGSRGARPCV